MKAFAYLRVSGKGQLEGDGFTRQRLAIERYAAPYGIKIVRWFQEEGVSGTRDLEHRPALQKLMLALHANSTRLVLIERLDRLARDLMVQEAIIGDLRKNGFELISVAEPDLCSDDPSRKLVRQVFGAIAEYERTMTVLKLRAARERVRTRAGRCEGRKPYGERVGETEVIARARDLARRGMSYSLIATTLNAERRPTRGGGRWFPATVSRILNRTS
jgi:DNA invertase Pin-like site-specific DNA recombinase